MNADERAPVRVLALIRDLMFRSKIDALAAALGAEVAYASTLDAGAHRCAIAAPAVVLADLSEAGFSPSDTVVRMRAAAPGARLVGFASHVELKSIRTARAAGFDLVLSRSEFAARLPELLGPA